MLNPGGVLGIIGHHGDAGAEHAALRRIEKARVVEAPGFNVTEEGDLVANPDECRTEMVFAEAIRGKTGRFLLRPAKPEGR